MRDFRSHDNNLYRVASRQHPVKHLGSTYTEHPNPVLGICIAKAHYIREETTCAKVDHPWQP